MLRGIERHTLPPAVKAWDNVADRYDQLYADAVCQAENAALTGILRDHGLLEEFGAQRRVLDLGCGTGFYADLVTAANANVHVTGVDLAPHMLARAREKHPRHSWEPMDLDAPHYLGMFNGVVSTWGSLSYVQRPAVLLSRLTLYLTVDAPAVFVLYAPARRPEHEQLLGGRFRAVPTRYYTPRQADELFWPFFHHLRTFPLSARILPENWPVWAQRAGMMLDWMLPSRARYTVVTGFSR